jgi:hypothetical protein
MQQIFKELGLPKADIDQFESIFTERISFENGQFFIEEGAIVKGIGFITKGAFRYFYYNEGEEITRWVSLEGDFITSLSSFIDRKPTTENIQAMKESELPQKINGMIYLQKMKPYVFCGKRKLKSSMSAWKTEFINSSPSKPSNGIDGCATINPNL